MLWCVMNNITSILLVAAIATTVATVGIQSAFAATNAFGNAVSQQAQNGMPNGMSFGEWQSGVATGSINIGQNGPGLGQFNCATCTPLK
jgi:hypothetical protein